MGATKKSIASDSSLIEGLDWKHARVEVRFILDSEIVDSLSDEQYDTLKDSAKAKVKLSHEILLKYLKFHKKYPKEAA